MESTTTTTYANANNNSKTNFLFVLTAPRSLSTVFLRSFLEHPSVAVFNDSVTTCKLGHSTGTFEEHICQLEKNFDEAISMGKTIVLKDMAFIAQKYFDIIRRWNQKYNMKFMYLVRHPKAQYTSLEKAIALEKTLKRIPDSYWDSWLQRQWYKPIWDVYLEFNGHIVIAEDLQRDPHHTLRQAFAYADIKFSDEYLQFEKLADKGIPEDWKFGQLWYTDCLNSTSIRSGVTDLSAIKLTSELAVRQVTESDTYYMNFLSIVAANKATSV